MKFAANVFGQTIEVCLFAATVRQQPAFALVLPFAQFCLRDRIGESCSEKIGDARLSPMRQVQAINVNLPMWIKRLKRHDPSEAKVDGTSKSRHLPFHGEVMSMDWLLARPRRDLEVPSTLR